MSIKTWQERVAEHRASNGGSSPPIRGVLVDFVFRDAEIADLRARVAHLEDVLREIAEVNEIADIQAIAAMVRTALGETS